MWLFSKRNVTIFYMPIQVTVNWNGSTLIYYWARMLLFKQCNEKAVSQVRLYIRLHLSTHHWGQLYVCVNSWLGRPRHLGVGVGEEEGYERGPTRK